eukprot:7133609-Pyramimonas_sp.AAC.1
MRAPELRTKQTTTKVHFIHSFVHFRLAFTTRNTLWTEKSSATCSSDGALAVETTCAPATHPRSTHHPVVVAPPPLFPTLFVPHSDVPLATAASADRSKLPKPPSLSEGARTAAASGDFLASSVLYHEYDERSPAIDTYTPRAPSRGRPQPRGVRP